MRFFIVIILSASLYISASLGEEASNHYYKGRTIQSMRVYMNGLKSAIARADVKSEVLYLNNIAVLFNTLQENDSTNKYLDAAQKAAHLSEPLTTITSINRAFLNKQYLAIDSRSLKKWEDSLTVYEVAALYIAVGRMELSAQKENIAETYFKRAIKLLKKENKTPIYADALYYQGMASLAKKEYDKSEKILEEAFVIYKDGGYTTGLRKVLAALVLSASANNRTAQAEQYEMLLNRLPK
jgi:tetratricopeptide (TPR) repeat protein